MAPLTALVVALLGLTNLALAHNIQMKAHTRECFHEQLHKDDVMTVTFQVGDREFGGSGNLDIDFWVRHQNPHTSIPITHVHYHAMLTSCCLLDPKPSKRLPSPRTRRLVRRPFLHRQHGR